MKAALCGDRFLFSVPCRLERFSGYLRAARRGLEPRSLGPAAAPLAFDRDSCLVPLHASSPFARGELL